MTTTTTFPRPRSRFARDLKRGDDVLLLGRRGTIRQAFPIYRENVLVTIRLTFVDMLTEHPWTMDVLASTPVARFEREEA